MKLRGMIIIAVVSLILAVAVLLNLAHAQNRNMGVSSDFVDVDTAKVLRLCSEYLGKDINPPDADWSISIDRVADSSERMRVGIPGHGPERLVKVSLGHFPLDFAWDADGHLVDWYRKFDIYIDDDNEKLVKIVSTIDGWSDSLGRTTDEVSRIDSTMLNKTMRFMGYPDSIGVSLLLTLRQCPHSPQLASYISARYVTDKDIYTDSVRTLWVVCLIGMPPFPLIGHPEVKLPKHESDYARVHLDGRTGKYICSGN